MIICFAGTDGVVPPIHCAYKNGNMQLNVSNLSSEESEARDHLMKYVQTSRGTFLDNGYERCDTTLGTSYCYSFWVLDDENKPNILKQGKFSVFRWSYENVKIQ